jgi:hypothetical protein
MVFYMFGTNKNWRKFLVEILQYTKNFHIPASMKMNQVYIWSAFWKHGWIIWKPGVQVSIGHCIIENENKVTGRSKIPQECKNWDFWATGGCGRWATE